MQVTLKVDLKFASYIDKGEKRKKLFTKKADISEAARIESYMNFILFELSPDLSH